MKHFLILCTFCLVFTACSSMKTKEPAVENFACELGIDIFAEKTANIVNFGGFEIVSTDTADNAYLVIAQKVVTMKGSGENQEAVYDQIRFRYNSVEKKVWVSHGILTSANGKKKFTAPPAEDVQRHNEVVLRTIDRVFSQCNPGIFPNRP